jgi:hypothetical protein
VCSAVLENLIRFDYGCGRRGASSVISRLSGYIDGLIFSGALCDGSRRVGELAIAWLFSVACLDMNLSSKTVCTYVLCRLQA